MVSISKFGDSAIKFTFDDSDHYLMGDGEITVPVNGLILVLDESDMATFKKIDGDPFISFNIADSNFSSKSDLETFYKENMVGSTGGGGGVTSGEVQTMIDESVSGLSDDISTVSGDVNTLSGSVESLHSAVSDVVGDVSSLSGDVANKADTTAVTASINAVSGAIPTQYVREARVDNDEGKQRWYVFQKEGQNAFNIYNFSINGRMPLSKQNGTYKNVDNFSLVETSAVTSAITSSSTNSQVASAKAVYDAIGDKADTTAVTASINAAVSGKMDTSVFNTYSASTDARLSEDEEVTSAALNELNDALDDKADTTAVTESINAAVSGKADTSAVTASITAAVSGKQDTLIAGTNITISGNVISAEGGGGKAIVAGTNISVTTGETADTVSCTLPITAGTGGGITINRQGNTAGTRSFAGGEGCKASSQDSFAFGLANTASSTGSTAFGFKTNTNVHSSFVCGKWNDVANANTGENFGSSGNTVFAVGNGWKQNDWTTSGTIYKHNAIDIRQNGDIYIADTNDTTYQNYYEKPMIKLQDALGGGGLPESAFTAYTAATDARLAEDEEVTAASLNALNDAIDDKADASDLGGLKLVQLTQAEYDALTTKDSSTLYIITSSN